MTAYSVHLYIAPNGRCPAREYIDELIRSGRRRDSALIERVFAQLRESGSRELVKIGRAEKMNDVWQLRAGRHRQFYFWDAASGAYVILNGFLKQSRRTPRGELRRAERLRADCQQAR